MLDRRKGRLHAREVSRPALHAAAEVVVQAVARLPVRAGQITLDPIAKVLSHEGVRFPTRVLSSP